MKVTKVVKYKYKLTEETLEKDIESFIKDARIGIFFWDFRNNGEGLKIIKQYFRILKEKFENKKYEECKVCYGKLILFLIDSSVGEDEANFGYEDLIAKVDKDFDRFIKNYFVCLVKTCDLEELTERVSEYAVKSERAGYWFQSGIKILIENLDENILNNLEQRMLIKTEGMTEKDEDKINIIHFLMEIAHMQENKEKYLELCERLRGVVPEEEIDYIVWELDETE